MNQPRIVESSRQLGKQEGMQGVPVMVARFERRRWSPERKTVHALKVGQRRAFHAKQYFNVYSSVSRLNDAYEGQRVWKMRHSPFPVVTRLK